MSDLFSKFDALIAERQALLDTGVRDPFAIVMDKVLSPTLAVIQGKETILLGTYNYMGMTFDPDVIDAGKRALDEFDILISMNRAAEIETVDQLVDAVRQLESDR